ncbi:hypothetical protein [Methylophilus aquaticus]|uniref:Yip1 domain-containing protein n=1 Tax=Methylophilus aquaticus TaxID=1971610 RepID=A0ABT9JRZ7_9PROT|nr:hypothetical protein [Methylophilus aquaticus]MDP8567306.1 hypothetical protein [Methylophilus aquaticus]
MNLMRLIYFLTPESNHAKLFTVDKPNTTQLLLWYVLPLSFISSVMVYLRLYHQYSQLFIDNLPGDRLLMIGGEVLLLQVTAVLAVAWITKNLVEMVNVKTTFRDALLVITIATLPLWLASFIYLIPSFNFNVVVHVFAVLGAVMLICRGVYAIFGLRERGAAAILSMAIAGTASLGFGIVLISTLISWDGIEQLQYAVTD